MHRTSRRQPRWPACASRIECYTSIVIPERQLSLLGHEDLAFDARLTQLERITLEEGAWLDVARGWLRGHARLFEILLGSVAFRADTRTMYDHEVVVPRLHASLDEVARPAVIEAMRAALSAHYAVDFARVSVALYRDGRDSVAWHGDFPARHMPETLVATVSVGAARRFLLRRTGGGPSRSTMLGWGDLLVMGGTCQRTYQHAIPKVAQADPRISIMFRPIWTR